MEDLRRPRLMSSAPGLHPPSRPPSKPRRHCLRAVTCASDDSLDMPKSAHGTAIPDSQPPHFKMNFIGRLSHCALGVSVAAVQWSRTLFCWPQKFLRISGYAATEPEKSSEM